MCRRFDPAPHHEDPGSDAGIFIFRCSIKLIRAGRDPALYIGDQESVVGIFFRVNIVSYKISLYGQT
jgi:hypothetical protein